LISSVEGSEYYTECLRTKTSQKKKLTVWCVLDAWNMHRVRHEVQYVRQERKKRVEVVKKGEEYKIKKLWCLDF